jgi:hypothetical protein
LELHDESQECVLYLPNINRNEKHIAYMWHNTQTQREAIKSCNACTKNTKTNREEVSQISCIEKRHRIMMSGFQMHAKQNRKLHPE